MGSDLHMNPLREWSTFEWEFQDDGTLDLVRYHHIEGQQPIESKRYHDPSDEVVAALDTFLKVPEKPIRWEATPTEWLVLEVLQARILRMGGPFWSMPTSLGKTLKGLEQRGVVHCEPHNVEGAYKVFLTEAGTALLR